MKMNKDQFFSALARGKVKNFVYNGVKYYAEDGDLTNKPLKNGVKEVIIKTPKTISLNDLIKSEIVIKFPPTGKDNMLIQKLDGKILITDPDLVEDTYGEYIKFDKNYDYALISAGIPPKRVIDSLKPLSENIKLIIFKK